MSTTITTMVDAKPETPERREARRQEQYANDGEWERWQTANGRDPRETRHVPR